MIPRPPYAYRADPAVPAFPDDAPVVIYDGVCPLCVGWIGLVARKDPAVRFLAGQSAIGQALFRHYGLDAKDFETWLLLEEGAAHGSMAAIVRLVGRWGGAWRLAAGLARALPRPLADWLYRRIARNRFALLRRRAACLVPDPAFKARFIAWE